MSRETTPAELKLDTAKGPRDHREWAGDGAALWWLGQAGFLLRIGRITLAIDPYLSDALAEKYKGTEFPHRRMIAPPIAPEELVGADYFISTHAHSDHMDPGLLPIAAENNPFCRFLCPEAVRRTALERGAPPERLGGLEAGVPVALAEGIVLTPIPAAHETLETDEGGRNKFLGLVIESGSLTLYHSGDCCPYSGLEDHLAQFSIDLALLPVNGRRPHLRGKNIPGNFSLTEARSLCRRLGISYLLAHHFGMFAFNTVRPERLTEEIRLAGEAGRYFAAEMGICYNLKRRNTDVGK